MIPIRINAGFGENSIRETLNRIGIPNSSKNKTLIVSTALVVESSGIYIAHFKELLGIPMSDDDRKRLETIVSMLVDWKMIDSIAPITRHRVKIFVAKHNDGWKAVHKIAS